MYRVQKVWKSLLSIWFVAATAVMMFRCFVAGAPEEQSKAVIYKILAVIVSVMMPGCLCILVCYVEHLHKWIEENIRNL